MPTYEYNCSACGHAFERSQSITADPVKRCPQCGKNKVKRLIGTGAGLIFKGSGFYITDYRDAGYKEKAKAESGASGGGEASSNGKAETKAGGDAGGAVTPTPSTSSGASGPESKPAATKPESGEASTSSAKAASKPAASKGDKKR